MCDLFNLTFETYTKRIVVCIHKNARLGHYIFIQCPVANIILTAYFRQNCGA
jgi:hypothetical protein